MLFAFIIIIIIIMSQLFFNYFHRVYAQSAALFRSRQSCCELWEMLCWNKTEFHVDKLIQHYSCILVIIHN